MAKPTKKQKEIVAFYRNAVENGVKILDKEFGHLEWLKKIDEKKLDLKSNSACMCGQLFGYFWNSEFKKFKIKLPTNGWEARVGSPEMKFSVSNGFVLRKWEEFGKYGDYGNWDLLTNLWYVKIVELKIEAGLIP